MVGEDHEEVESEENEDDEESWLKGRSRRRIYSIRDAVRAHRQYFLDQGVTEAALSTVSFDGWKEKGPGAFVSRDTQGKLRCSLVFIDEEGSAEITFSDGESDSVTIEDE
jgi:hypothetical protein